MISSKFLDDCLEKGELLPPKKYPLRDKMNEAKLGFSLQKSISRARANKGKLLWRMPIYCTDGIENGVSTFQQIALANGAIFMTYRARSGTTIKPTTPEEDEGADPEPVYLVTGGLAAERNLWPKFEKMARQGSHGASYRRA